MKLFLVYSTVACVRDSDELCNSESCEIGCEYSDNQNWGGAGIFTTEEEAISACLGTDYRYAEILEGEIGLVEMSDWKYPCKNDDTSE